MVFPTFPKRYAKAQSWNKLVCTKPLFIFLVVSGFIFLRCILCSIHPSSLQSFNHPSICFFKLSCQITVIVKSAIMYSLTVQPTHSSTIHPQTHPPKCSPLSTQFPLNLVGTSPSLRSFGAINQVVPLFIQ